MLNATTELPLAFEGHTARIVIEPLSQGGWHVRAEVDTRTLGWEQYMYWVQVEHFHMRVQQWLKHAEATERRVSCAV